MGAVLYVLYYRSSLYYVFIILSIEWNIYLNSHETYAGTAVLYIDYHFNDIDAYSIYRQVFQSYKYNDSLMWTCFHGVIS